MSGADAVALSTGVIALRDPSKAREPGARTVLGELLRWSSWAHALNGEGWSTGVRPAWAREQCWAQLFGLRSTIVFKALFVLCTWLGAIFQAQAVLDFGDLMVLGMAVPNITGVLLLSGKIRTDLEMYLERLRAGEFARHRELAM